MITLTEASDSITEIGEYEGWKTGKYDKRSVDNLLKNIFASIGRCSDCLYGDAVDGSNDIDIIECKRDVNVIYMEQDDFCSHYNPEIKDRKKNSE